MNRLAWLPAAVILALLVGLAGCDSAIVSPVPSGSPALPSLSLTPDPSLAARFPTTIDGEPVVLVQTGRFVDVMTQLGAPDATIASVTQDLGAVGIDFGSMTAGFATATVDGTTVRLQALRTPNVDAGAMVTNYAVLAEAFGSAFGSAEDSNPTVAPSTVAGRNVEMVTYSDGNRTVLYTTGDTMFIIDNTADSQTTKIVQALP